MPLTASWNEGTLPDVQLDLEAERISREAEAQVRAALERLPAAMQKSLLERVAFDVLTAIAASGNMKQVGHTAPPKTIPSPISQPAVLTEPGHDGPSLWEKILAYCEEYPTHNGKFRCVDIADAIFPNTPKDKHHAVKSTVYTSVKRRSVGESSDPRFVWLSNGTFRIATPDERAKAK